MDSQRLLNVPRSFLFAVDEARAACGFRLDFINATDPSDIQPKFFLNISDVSAGRVMFSFLNTAPETWSITHVYFDDGEVMVIDVVTKPANDTKSAPFDEPLAVDTGTARPGTRSRSLHENLAIIFDLRRGIGMADIICALNEERLKVSLKAARQDSDTREIFVNNSLLTLCNAYSRE